MSDSTQPLISVIIPTRERADTLKYAIATALNQDLDEYEVVVSDNFSQDNTQEIVQAISDPRLKCFNTGRRLSMCDNYEFALGQAKGRYTIIIGDDDAIMPGAICRLRDAIKFKPYPVYSWPKGIYVWPFADRAAAVERIPSIGPAQELNLRELARRCVRQGLWGYTRLPNAYHAAVEKRVLDDIRGSTGRVFHSTQPDLFTGFALPAFVETALNLGDPVTFHGRSPKSNAAVAVAREGLESIRRYVGEFRGYPIHRTLYPGIPVHGNLLADSLLVAMDMFPQLYGGIKFNYEGMWTVFCLNKTFRFGVGTRETLRRAGEIRQYHPFSIIRFLGYLAMFKTFLALRETLRRPAQTGPFGCDVPDNILDFVNELHSWRLTHGTHSL